MTIRLKAEDRARRYTMGDFKPLAVHYREKRIPGARDDGVCPAGPGQDRPRPLLVLDYFSLGRIKFLNKYFADRKV